MSNQINSNTMDTRSQMKIMAAGFRILRTQDQPSPIIKIKELGRYEWRTLEKFETKAARDRRLAELLLDEKIVQD
ncbi:MAG TPA: hypothetical protein DCG34_01765 [Clostridiales bacterium]|nr:hypothetical protein [Clostridiales bacterium]